MEDKFSKTEYTLYNYNSLDVKIRNIDIDIENLENDITIKAVNYDEKATPTNAFNSTVENEVIRREEYVQDQLDKLRAKKKYNEDLKVKIDGALSQLSPMELKLIELRYFQKEKLQWTTISMKLGFDKDYCSKIKSKIIKRLGDLIFP